MAQLSTEKNIVERFANVPKKEISADEYEAFINYKQSEIANNNMRGAKDASIEQVKNMHKHMSTNGQQSCQQMLDHIYNCDHCMKEIYKRYNCSNHNTLSFDVSMFITKENKEILTVVLLGLLIMLIIQLFKNN